MGRLVPLVLLAALAAGCRTDPPEPPPAAPAAPAPASADTVRETSPEDAPPPTPFDAAPIVFDTIEPPERVVQIPPRPQPSRPPPTPPRPAPTHARPAGSCDVRETESFCFAYTGTGWTPAAAQTHCAAAPASAFGAGTCPTEGRIATCTFRRPSEPTRELVYTYYEPYDVGLAELACPGEFTRVR